MRLRPTSAWPASPTTERPPGERESPMQPPGTRSSDLPGSHRERCRPGAGCSGVAGGRLGGQGVEAGGHVQGSLPLASALPGVLEAAGSVPVVAAGGIADAPAIAEALQSGAQGVMLGTRFVATRESRAHEEYKASLLQAH